MSFGLKDVLSAAGKMVLKSGYLDPVLNDISKYGGVALTKITGAIDFMELIWHHKRSQGEHLDETFSQFCTAYTNGILAGAIDRNHVDAPRIIAATVDLLKIVGGTSGKFWLDALKNVQGFSETPLAQNSLDAFHVAQEEFRPVVESIIEFIREDYRQAMAWKNQEIKTPV